MQLSFYCRKSKADRNGLSPIELSIIINGKRVFIQLPRKEYPEAFKKQYSSKRTNDLREYLDEVRNKFNQIQTQMMHYNVPLTTDTLKEWYKTGGVQSYTVKSLWDEYLSMIIKRVGKSLTKGSYERYVNASNIFYRYIPQNTELSTLTPAMMQKLLIELQSIYEDSTVAGLMTKFKTVIMYARDNGKIQINPFNNVKYVKTQKEIEYLDEGEIHRLKTKSIEIERLSKIRDIAVFQLSSGLSYIDTLNLRKEDIHFTEDGTCYIYKARHKTNILYTSVVLPDGVEVLKKYNYELPVISNQRMNAYLKEIQVLCGIRKNLHCHLFRKTYATLLLNKGVRLETVSKLLGHTNTLTTQSAYGKLLKQTVIDEVKKVAF